ncbi:hypothetical protein Barb6XT_02385 [Bacteroidales bacterium Barb6XT]|nr:hypothetical protein Barb6XT_02385 [Bacteroidales bacterium Barb6XT]
MPEYYKNTICLSYGELTAGDPKAGDVEKAPVMTVVIYRHLYNRNQVTVLRRGCYGTPTLIEYRSLPLRFKERVCAKYGDPERSLLKCDLRNMAVKDLKAEAFHQGYSFDGRGFDRLTPEAVMALYDRRTMAWRSRNGSTREVWPVISRELNAVQAEFGCRLPENAVSLRRKVALYREQGYASLISKKHGNANGRKVKSREQDALLTELIGYGGNLNFERIAEMYNTVASRMNWPAVTAATVSNHAQKKACTHPGRHGAKEYFNSRAMQVKRSGPTCPLYFWTSDGWDTELLYAEKKTNRDGHSVTTYHHRPNVVLLLDPFNNYIIGYAIGTNESAALIRQVYRNAMEHVRELFGGYYKPWQIQTDNYQKKNLKPFYEACTQYYTPAAVGNAKVIEPFFHRWNDECFRLFRNSSGIRGEIPKVPAAERGLH